MKKAALTTRASTGIGKELAGIHARHGGDLIVRCEDELTAIKSRLEKPVHFFDDDSSEVNPDLTAKPSLCTSCKKDDDPAQAEFCDLNRFDRRDDIDVRLNP